MWAAAGIGRRCLLTTPANGIEQFRHVLVLGAHPDDEMGCSGSLARLAASGAQVDLVTFSDCNDLIPAGFSVDDLVEEWRTATSLLGIPNDRLRLLSIPNRRFPEHRQTILATLDELLQNQYDLVFAPARSDAHQDHGTVAAEATRAFKHTTLLGYELPMNTLGESLQNCYVPLTGQQVEQKVRHAAAYESQAHRRYMDESYLRGLASVRGVQAGVPFADAFEVIRWIA
jgi:LmbE family N-acetylglucosaminyl deacetylase